MLSAAGAVTDRIVGLEVGADDFLAKPCDPREMLARIRAVMRRARERVAPAPDGDLDVFEFDGWRFHAARRELFTPSGGRVALSTGEYALLRAFLERPQRILSRDQLLDLARGRDTFAYDRAVDVQVSRLRKRLEGVAPGADLIRTVRNEGYLFVPAVRRGR
jgi:two-component system OmpR family response regulator